MEKKLQNFLEQFPLMEQQKILAPFTTLQIGGPADLYYALTDIEELEPLIQEAKKQNIPFFILGGGSNTVFHDDGFRGVIIHIKAKKITVENETIIADAGALLSQVLQAALKNGLTGMEKMMGLPGTVGGAVRGNAGAFGTEIKDILKKALVYNAEKGLQEVPNDYFEFRYRTSTVKKNRADIVLRAWFRLAKGDTKKAMQETAPVLAERLKKQPSGKTSGSFFKNPSPDKPAGLLLDQADCKGLQSGQAQVSPLHANWIMNLGGATQKDVMELAKTMQQRVKERFNIDLEPEVQFVGLAGMTGI